MKQWWVWFNLREIFLLSSWFIHVTCQVDSKYKCRKFWYQFLSVIFFFSAVVALSGNTGFSSSIKSRLKASFPLLVSIRNRTRWAHTVYIECHRFLPMELEFIIPVCYLFRKGKKIGAYKSLVIPRALYAHTSVLFAPGLLFQDLLQSFICILQYCDLFGLVILQYLYHHLISASWFRISSSNKCNF